MLPSSWKSELQKSVEEAADIINKRNEQDTCKIASAIESFVRVYSAQQGKPERPDKFKRAIDIATLSLLFATALFTALAWWVFRNQLHTFDEQLTEMRKVYKPINEQAVAAQAAARTAEEALIASDRPWIDIKSIVINDICVDANGARVSIEFDLINIGNSPAFRVEPWTASTVALQGAPDQTALFARPPVGIRDMQQPDTLFPDKAPHGRFVSAYVPNSQLKWLTDKKMSLFPVRTDVGVDYAFKGSTSYPHQTCYSLTLIQKATGLLLTSIPTPENCVRNIGYSYGDHNLAN